MKGIDLKVEREPPCREDEIARAEALLAHSLPHELRNFYLTIANGLDVYWEELRSPRDFDFGRLCIPSLARLAQDYQEFHNDVVDQYTHPEEYFDRIDEARS